MSPLTTYHSIAVLLPSLCNALLSNNRIYLSNFSILKIAAVCHIRPLKIKTLILRQVLLSENIKQSQ